MQITFDNSSNRPIYQQIIDHIKRDIALGRLKIGEKLPTVRHLASTLVINPNTIAKAYRQLEKDGIIITRPGAGAFIAELSTNLSLEVRSSILIEQIELLLVEAIHMNISSGQLNEWLKNAMEKFKFE